MEIFFQHRNVLTTQTDENGLIPEADFGEWQITRRIEQQLDFGDFLHEVHTMKHSRVVKSAKDQYHVDEQSREALARVGGLLCDMARFSTRAILPNKGPEMLSFATQAYVAADGGEPVELFTPVCPDWSRDHLGRYDFKSLGSGPSGIAEKFFQEGKELLKAFRQNRVSYHGTFVFADWGSETEITAKDTYGDILPADEVVRRFAASFDATEDLLQTQQRKNGGELFRPYRLMSMTEFLSTRLDDPQKVCEGFHQRFLEESQATQLLDQHATTSFPINKQRLGISDEEENRHGSVVGLSEYATLGEAIGSGVIVAAESRMSSRAYNIFRPKRKRLPVVFLKGSKSVDEAENIL